MLEVDTWVEPGGGVSPHVHPSMDEQFTVLEGRMSFLAGREWSEASAGETAVVPAGLRHAYRNDSEETAHMICEARPPSTLEEFLKDTAAMSRAGKFTRRGIPRGLDGAPRGHRACARLPRDGRAGLPAHAAGAPSALLFPPLARLAERRGYRPGNFEAAFGSSNGAG